MQRVLLCSIHVSYSMHQKYATHILFTYQISYIIYQKSNIIYHISNIVYHISYIKYCISYIICHISNIKYHISYIIYHIQSYTSIYHMHPEDLVFTFHQRCPGFSSAKRHRGRWSPCDRATGNRWCPTGPWPPSHRRTWRTRRGSAFGESPGQTWGHHGENHGNTKGISECKRSIGTAMA